MDFTLDKRLQGFQLIAQEKLQAIICSIPGKKDLILDPSLIKPLEHVCSASWLKLKGIQRIYKFDAESHIPRNTDGVQIFMIRSQLDTFKKVLQQVHEHEAKLPSDVNEDMKNFHVICVPSCFGFFQTILEEEGLFGLVQLHRYSWDFIYIDSGVLSMELSNVFSSIFLHGDTSILPSIAHSLRILQLICGKPNIIVSYGEYSETIVKMMKTLDTGTPSTANKPDSEFGALMIIDRDKDYASCLLTPAIYAGLLLEVFNYRTGEIEIEGSSNKILRQKLKIFLSPKFSGKTEHGPSEGKNLKIPSKPSVIRLNSVADEIYGENRYKHFSQASSLVRAQAKAIGLEVQKLGEMKINEMHEYVARKLPKITELKSKVMRHLNASENIIEMLAGNFQRVQSLEEDILNNTSRKKLLQEIDELLTIDAQQFNTLRLLCLLHLSAGLSSEELSHFIRNYCNYFGSNYLPIFSKLAKAGLLPTIEEEKSLNKSAKILSNLPIPKFQQTEFQANANRLKLLVSSSGSPTETDAEDSNAKQSSSTKEGNGICPSYVFNSLYIPLIAQLSSLLLKVNSSEELTKLSMIEKLQIHIPDSPHTAHNLKSFANAFKQADLKDYFPIRKRNVFVFVVGGVTYSEIGACELVSRITGTQIIVASDRILSGSDVIASAF